MNIRKFATITVLVLSSFAATNVAPTKAELESMYDKAFREFNANNYPQALKELDAIDARQPDLAESQNLRGVILMRQAEYDQAEAALQKALATDPKFWNARFNLAEIPFLRKDWAEARKRFDALLQGNAAELQGEAAQLIQYKILLTYLLQGNENMVDSILAKFELSPDTPAANYSHAAIALQHKNEKEAKDLLATAEKNFSPQLNKLFAESLYEVGWLQKPVGQTRAALELTSAADRAAKAKSLATEKYEQAEQAFQQRDLTAARRLVDEADAADPNQPATINLRGEILLAQKDFDGAEAAFKQALKLDSKLPEAHYNLAQIPFKKKEYAKARDRFEALFSATPAPGGDKNQAAQIIKFKIYLTLLLEGKDSRAQKMMEQFQFTGDTPALYYAQAAWEFKHNNTAKANDWIVSARKIYSPALNLVFADSFYDLGWLQKQAPATVTASTETAKTDAPSIEPSPIPAAGTTKTAKQPAESAQVPLTSQALVAKNDKAATAPESSPKVEMPVASNALPSETRAPLPPEPEQVPATVPAASTEVAQQEVAQQSPAGSQANAPANKVAPAIAATTTATTPATVLAPATVREWAQPVSGGIDSNTLLVGALLLAGIVLLAWVVISELRRRVNVRVYRSPAPAMGPRFDADEQETPAQKIATAARLAGGPPQVSLQLKASEPSVRRAAVPFGKMSRPFGAGGATIPAAGNGTVVENFIPREKVPLHQPEPKPERTAEIAPAPLPAAEAPYASDPTPEPVVAAPDLASAPEWEFAPARTEMAPSVEEAAPAPQEMPMFAEAPAFEAPAAFAAPAVFEAPAVEEPAPVEAFSQTATFETPAFEEPAPVEAVSQPATFETPAFEEPAPVEAFSQPATFETPAFEEPAPVEAFSQPATFETPAFEEAAPVEAFNQPATFEPPAFEEPEFVESVSEPIPSEVMAQSAVTPAAEIYQAEIEPVAQGQPIPYQVPAFSTDSPMAEITKPEPESLPTQLPEGAIAGVGGLRHSVESPSFAPQVISTEPLAQQPTTPATMPQPIQPTPAPIRTAPMTGAGPQSQPASGMHTAVQLTFSFEIASMQLTPSFKMGALQLKPTSKIVTMRLAPSQQPQPAMNLQVTFEIATVQLAGNAIGMVRLTPSQQQRPSVISSPSFNVAG
ncbi:MAG TPA: tetratricopeptide repeat protein, partial [Chthoniobacterales bacterium]|nr:tetratricopeptide repeat protein [Chthoniobacterales bacterium]